MNKSKSKSKSNGNPWEDAQAGATLAANFVMTYLFHVHQGVIDGEHLMIAYGNDGYSTDPVTKEEVRLLRERLPALGLEEVAFGTSTEPDDPERPEEVSGYSWALVVRPTKEAIAAEGGADPLSRRKAWYELTERLNKVSHDCPSLACEMPVVNK